MLKHFFNTHSLVKHTQTNKSNKRESVCERVRGMPRGSEGHCAEE